MAKPTGLVLTDWRGNEYGVGDTIVYATSQSSTVTMNEAEVVEIIPTPDKRQPAKLKVRVTNSTSGWRLTRASAKEKLTTLTSVERVTKMEKP